jgi:hypothetical protein
MSASPLSEENAANPLTPERGEKFHGECEKKSTRSENSVRRPRKPFPCSSASPPANHLVPGNPGSGPLYNKFTPKFAERALHKIARPDGGEPAAKNN